MEKDTKEFQKAILECFEDIPFIEVNILNDFCTLPYYRPDLVFKLDSLNNTQRLIVCEYKNNGQPRLARSAVDQLLRYVQDVPQAYPVFVAPYISPRSAEICRDQGVGYIDLAGNCRLSFDNVYILKEGKKNPYSNKRDLRSLFSPKAERILRVMLSNPGNSWKIEELANTAEVSLGQVSNVKKLLADREWIDAFDFKLTEPRQLLMEWGVAYQSGRNKRTDYYSFQNVNDLECSVAEACEDMGLSYALTGFSAAARRIPMVRYQRANIYVNEDSEGLIERLGIKKVTSGANLSIWEPYDAGVLYGIEKVEGINLVSSVQNYLDLQGDRGRGEEAAVALLEGVLDKLW